MTTAEKFESWGLLELMGHQRVAGKLGEQTIGGVHFIRVDVPAVGSAPEYTRYFTQAAIYGMTPTSEDVARRLAEGLRAVPISVYDLPAPKAAPASRADEMPAIEHDDDDAPGYIGWVECGETYEGTVTKIVDFGALVELQHDDFAPAEGLLHISQIAHGPVNSVADYLAEGQAIRVKVIETDYKGRIKLSMKALVKKPDDDDIPW